jgi:hypothetical protein
MLTKHPFSNYQDQSISSPSFPQPSGIAQLRKASDHHFATDSPSPQGGDPMNLDDFLVSTSIASPSPSDDNMMNTTAIPIPNKSFAAEQAALLSRTAPLNHHAIRREGDFGYVNKHLRKTSIDDRRVRIRASLGIRIANNSSRSNESLTHPRRFLLLKVV